VQHRFGFEGRWMPLQPKAVSALRSATAVHNLPEFRQRSV
jgi:hypothetical protein